MNWQGAIHTIHKSRLAFKHLDFADSSSGAGGKTGKSHGGLGSTASIPGSGSGAVSAGISSAHAALLIITIAPHTAALCITFFNIRSLLFNYLHQL